MILMVFNVGLVLLAVFCMGQMILMVVSVEASGVLCGASDDVFFVGASDVFCVGLVMCSVWG